MNKPECRVCRSGSLEIREVAYFSSLDVRILARVIFWFGCVGIFLSTLLGLVSLGVYATGGTRGPAVSEFALMVALPLVSALIALVGAIFSMKKPVLQCSNCTAVHRAG